MPENISQDLKNFRCDFKEFLSSVSSIDSNELRAQSLDAGYFRLAQPVGYGGGNAGPLKLAIARETVASAGIENVSDVIGPEPGMLLGSGKHIEEHFLTPMLTGIKRACFAFTELDNSNPTIAKWDGDSILVRGEKSYVSGAQISDFILVVLTVTSDEETLPSGPAVAIVDRNADGVSTSDPFYSIDGSGHCEITFDDVKVSSANIVGEVGRGMPKAIDNLVRERLEQAATATGMAIYATNLITKHLESPHRSGGKLGDLEGVRLRYADMRIQSFAARAVLYRVARLLDSGYEAFNEVTTAKVFCTETVSTVIDSSVQLVGGRALVNGHPLESLYRRIRSMRLAGGASDILRLGVSRGVLEFNTGLL